MRSYRFVFDRGGQRGTTAFIQARNLPEAIAEARKTKIDLANLISVHRLDAELTGNPLSRLPLYLWGEL